MKNFAKFNYYQIQTVFSNADIHDLSSDWHAIGISTDTRTIDKQNIFVALEGEFFDGHNCIDEAIKNGASAVVASSDGLSNYKTKNHKIPFIVVPDTLVALGELAYFHRSRYNLPIIAVAGSNGKTSTKELIYAVLSQKYRVLKTYKNFNNRIGVPLMMLQISDDYDVAVIEIGTNEIGEIAKLSQMLKPTHGIITNIGKEHLETLNNLDDVEMEESYLFGELLKTGGQCLINIDDDRLAKYTKVIGNSLTYGQSKDADIAANVEFDNNLHPTIYYKFPFSDNTTRHSAKINSIGLAIALNGIATIAVGYSLGLNETQITSGLESFTPANDGYARMLLVHKNNISFLNDCYNANPPSMEMSLKTLNLWASTVNNNSYYKIAVLGDMLELGNSSHIEHINIIKLALKLVDEVMVIGQNMKIAAKEILSQSTSIKLKVFSDFQTINKYILELPNRQKVALIKGSRELKMERLLTDV